MDKKTYIETEVVKSLQSWGLLASIAGAFAILSLSILDYFVMPEHFTRFLIYRLVTAALISLIFFLTKQKPSKYFILSLYSGSALIVSVMVELMILTSGGHQSIYYAGIIIVLMVCLGFLPLFSIKFNALLGLFIYLIYLLPILIFDKITNVRVFINNNIFLISAAFITFAWRYYNDKLYAQKLSLEYDLSQDKKQLEVYSFQLKSMVEERTKELHESEQWHRSLFENATDGIIVLDDHGIIVNVNDKTCEMHGFTRDALVGAHIKLLEIREDRGKMAERMRMILNGESIVYEAKHHKKDGSLMYLEVSSKAITIGDKLFIQSFYRDITEKKKFQEHLLQSQKMESIGVLAGGIAHDFNNILTAILGHTEIVRRNTSLEERALRSLNVIEDASRRAGRMISKLLGFARKTEYELISLNLNDVVYDTVKLLERVIDSKISLNLELANQIPLIQGDINQIEQIVMNLIVNARDAMPKGGKIAIRTESIAVTQGMPGIPPYIHLGEYNVLSITDTGTGIPDEIVNKIFEPFFTTKAQGKGTGLGLSMVYGAVKEHQGYITVQSRLNVGTTFTVYLPVARSMPSEARKAVAAPSVSGNETLFVVDDEAEILSSMQESLTGNGYKVVAVSDPSGALDTFKKISPEIALVITDIVMPQIDGKQLIQQIKLIKPEVKILAISGYTKYVANKEEIKEVNGFLQKPFESPHLLSVVRRILDTKPRSAVHN